MEAATRLTGLAAGGGCAAKYSAARLQELLERICAALGAPASVTVSEEEAVLTARISGGDLGLVIGKHGQTIDAIQYLANAVVFRGGEGAETERKDVVVDAAGYRSRREAVLERAAEQAAREALRTGEPVELEPMTAVERKMVHEKLKENPGVETTSEGTEPNRFVVITPAGG